MTAVTPVKAQDTASAIRLSVSHEVRCTARTGTLCALDGNVNATTLLFQLMQRKQSRARKWVT